jgi:hypothetical protein
MPYSVQAAGADPGLCGTPICTSVSRAPEPVVTVISTHSPSMIADASAGASVAAAIEPEVRLVPGQ